MNLEQQISRIKNVRKQLGLLEAELNELREQCKQQPEFEYPIYVQSKHNKSVIKFTGLTTGVVVVSGKYLSDDLVGIERTNLCQHTNTNYWQPIAFDKECGIADKQLCECWNDMDTHSRSLRFYDAKNKTTFLYNGVRDAHGWGNYRPIPYADYPEWAIEAEKTLED
jgi:hypothetical protein